MGTLLRLEKKPAGQKWQSDLIKSIADQLDSGKIITVEVKTPTMTPRQVAEELGISRTTVLRKIKSGKLPAFKRGNRSLIAVADFERFRTAYIRELGRAFADDF